MKHDVADVGLAKSGKDRIEWAEENMPVLRLTRQTFAKTKPLAGLRVGCCLHVTTETANLMITMKAGGALVSLCASNPLSTQDDVAASLVKDHEIRVFAVRGENKKKYYSHLKAVLDAKPHITMDDGADLVSMIHQSRRELAEDILGSTEETTTGVIRLKSMEAQNLLLFPVVAVNNAKTKHFFDNRYGTGQSTVDGIIRATNRLLAGSSFVVCGYGWCSRGIASRARGMGAHVTVTEVDPVRALEAVMDGYAVMPIKRAAKLGDIFVTATGDTHVITGEHFALMKDGAVVCNSGHFNVELELEALAKLAKGKPKRIREHVDQYTMKDGRRINLLGEGRLVNLAAAEGHPPSVMDMSFANQAYSAVFLKTKAGTLEPKVYNVPTTIDNEIAKLKLKAMGIHIDTLTAEQKEYLSSWEMGT